MLVTVVVLMAIVIAIFLFYSTDVTSNISSFEYELPYEKGTSHKVVQGYGGLFSHRHIAAIDFEMPVGTIVCAARDGVVYSFRDDSDEGGVFGRYKGKSNYIIIRHEDGSFGCYWHLKKGGILVKRGRVTKGQKIGISGATGQVLRPHLHFSVKRKLNYEENSFERTRFRTTEGVLLLKRGESYERPVE